MQDISILKRQTLPTVSTTNQTNGFRSSGKMGVNRSSPLFVQLKIVRSLIKKGKKQRKKGKEKKRNQIIEKLSKFVISAWMDRNWGGLKLRLSIKCHEMSVKCLISRCYLACKSLRFCRLKFLVSPSEKNLRLKLETWAEKTGYSRRLDVTRISINLKSLEVTRNNLDVKDWSVNYFCIFLGP